MATWKEREEVLLNSMGYQHTPITSDGSNYFALSLIDRGLADTRALKIAKAVNEGDWYDVTSAILQCDGSNFPRLFALEPRLFQIALDKTGDPALIERLEEVMSND
tara:strand:+ start:141 stop:458 length:318 start_codon:yes stop_codon:yes gene_type:complete